MYVIPFPGFIRSNVYKMHCSLPLEQLGWKTKFCDDMKSLRSSRLGVENGTSPCVKQYKIMPLQHARNIDKQSPVILRQIREYSISRKRHFMQQQHIHVLITSQSLFTSRMPTSSICRLSPDRDVCRTAARARCSLRCDSAVTSSGRHAIYNRRSQNLRKTHSNTGTFLSCR